MRAAAVAPRRRGRVPFPDTHEWHHEISPRRRNAGGRAGAGPVAGVPAGSTASPRWPSSPTTRNRSGPSPRPGRTRPPRSPTSTLLFRRPAAGRPGRPARGHRRRHQPGRQGRRRQRHRPQEPEGLPRQDRRQGAAADRGQRRARHRPRLLHRHRQLRRRQGRRPAGQGSAARRRHRRHLRRRPRRRSTPASGGRASSTSWPARRTSKAKDGADLRQGQEVQTLPHLSRSAGRRPEGQEQRPAPRCRTSRTSRTSA